MVYGSLAVLGMNIVGLIELGKRTRLAPTFEWKAEGLRLKRIYSLTRGERGKSLENKGRLLAALFSDASTHTAAPPSRAQAGVVEEQRPSKLQESADETRVLHPWSILNS